MTDQHNDLKREEREWFAATEFGVKRTKGYSCSPNNPGYWWCPEVGFSGCEGVHLFQTEDAAKVQVRANCEKIIAQQHAIIAKL